MPEPINIKAMFARAKEEHDAEILAEAARRAAAKRLRTNFAPLVPDQESWPEPKPLPSGLSPVELFSSEFLPDAFAPWVNDIARRLQCPPDYVAVSAMTALGSVIGRRIGIKPKLRDDWLEIANLWGLFVGRPGMLKSPAMGEALKPLYHLEAEAAKENEAAQQAYAAAVSAFKLRQSVRSSLERDAMKKAKTNKIEIAFDLGDEPIEPVPVRYRTNDSSYEAVGELLIGNPTGLLIERGEIVTLLRHLDRDDQAQARGFYLSAWPGKQAYTFDRIVRGHRHIEAACVGVLGNTQPSKIAEYVHRANADGTGGDGLIQRFGLAVWPDASAEWVNVDEFPNAGARQLAWGVFDRLSQLDETTAIRAGAEKGPYDKIPFLRFDEVAHEEFLGWHAILEARLRSGELSATLEAHLAKYRKLVPALALMNHMADVGTGQVGHGSLLKALAFAGYLETHAKRIYAAGSEIETSAAKAILGHVRKGHLADGFTARDVHQHGWSHLTDKDHVHAGLDLLAELDHLVPSSPPAGHRGPGRPKVTYRINPRTLR